jgi:hypothetical protein
LTIINKFNGSNVTQLSTGYFHSLVLANNNCFEKTYYNSGVCSGNGNCISQDTCSCNSLWYGNACDITTCNGTFSTSTSVCSGRGECKSPDVCVCHGYFGGNYCEYSTIWPPILVVFVNIQVGVFLLMFLPFLTFLFLDVIQMCSVKYELIERKSWKSYVISTNNRDDSLGGVERELSETLLGKSSISDLN